MSQYKENKKHYPRLYSDDKVSPEMLNNEKLMSHIYNLLEMEHQVKVGFSQLGNVLNMLGQTNTHLQKGDQTIGPVKYHSSHFWNLYDSDDDRIKYTPTVKIKTEV